MTKHPYLKEILKTTAKVALIAAGTYFVAAPFVWGLTATVLNAAAVADAAEAVVLCLGGYEAVKTAIKDIFTMRERVKKKQREEYVDEQLNELNKKVEKGNLQEKTPLKQKEVHPKTTQKERPTPKKIKWKKIKPLFWKRSKEYDRAA